MTIDPINPHAKCDREEGWCPWCNHPLDAAEMASGDPCACEGCGKWVMIADYVRTEDDPVYGAVYGPGDAEDAAGMDAAYGPGVGGLCHAEIGQDYSVIMGLRTWPDLQYLSAMGRVPNGQRCLYVDGGEVRAVKWLGGRWQF